jgi:peptide/nickel transport system substrate-binding protein
MSHIRLRGLLIATLSTFLILSGVAVSSSAAATSQVKRGGSMTVLIPSGSWAELDTATDQTSIGDARELSDIDGQLFEIGQGGTIIDDLATGYAYSDHDLTLTITLRHGVKFQDGTPFTAQAVAYNINRDLTPANACLCLKQFSPLVSSVAFSGNYNVVVHLTAPYAPFISAIAGSSLNEPESMVAVENAINSNSLTAFGQHPIGAGPFEIVSMVPNVSIVLTRNPHYWEAGHPYLNGLTFESTTSDQSDYEALTTGQAQATGFSTIPLVEQIKQSHSLNLNIVATTTYYFVLFNSMKAPFNNLLVREALSYATDPKQIIASVFDGIYKPAVTFCTAATLYCPKKVSTYDGYNPTKAKQLIAQYQSSTGQAFPTIPVYAFLPSNATLAEAIAQEWQAVGVTVDLTVVSVIPTYVTDYETGNWSAWVENSILNSNDPATGTSTEFGDGGTYSGAADPTLQGMLNRAQQLVSPVVRAPLYQKIFQYIDKMAYGIPLYQAVAIAATTKNVEGYDQVGGLVSPLDENVWLK